MAKFFRNFTEDALGSQPTGWTEAQDAALAQADIRADAWGGAGRVLRLEPRNYAGDSASILYSLLWTSLGVLAASAGCEIAGRFRTPVFTFSGQTFAFVSGQNAADSSSYQAGISSGGTRQLRRHTSRNASTVLDSGAGGLTVDTPYGFRLRRAAAVVTFKLWLWDALAGDFGESTATAYTATDGTPLADGYVGLAFNGATDHSGDNPFANALHWIEFDRVGAATAGETAPLTTLVPDTPTVTVASGTTTGVDITGSAFSSPISGNTHAHSQFRVLLASDNSVVYDSGSVAASVGPQTATGLTWGVAYKAQVRYQDQRGDWSAYGTSVNFTIPPVRLRILSTGAVQALGASAANPAAGPVLRLLPDGSVTSYGGAAVATGASQAALTPDGLDCVSFSPSHDFGLE
jgi:hypothetical protein